MPGIDHTLPLQDAVIAHLKGHAATQPLVGTRVYGPNPPEDPTLDYIRFGVPILGGYEASGGWRGSEGELTLHAFGAGPDNSRTLTLAAAIVEAMLDFEMEGAVSVIHCEWTRTQQLRDTGEPTLYHAVVQFEVGTVETVA